VAFSTSIGEYEANSPTPVRYSARANEARTCLRWSLLFIDQSSQRGFHRTFILISWVDERGHRSVIVGILALDKIQKILKNGFRLTQEGRIMLRLADSVAVRVSVEEPEYPQLLGLIELHTAYLLPLFPRFLRLTESEKRLQEAPRHIRET
jgi:hypothetical protein